MLAQEAEAYFAQWGDEGVVDLMQAFSDLIILTASRTLLGETPQTNAPRSCCSERRPGSWPCDTPWSPRAPLALLACGAL